MVPAFLLDDADVQSDAFQNRPHPPSLGRSSRSWSNNRKAAMGRKYRCCEIQQKFQTGGKRPFTEVVRVEANVVFGHVYSFSRYLMRSRAWRIGTRRQSWLREDWRTSSSEHSSDERTGADQRFHLKSPCPCPISWPLGSRLRTVQRLV